MKQYLSALPSPVGVYTGAGVRFEIYRAKDLHKKSWNSRELKSLVLTARSAYGRYGNRPLLDSYDTKAAIYLVRARYDVRGGVEKNEWLSIRMVPGDGKPAGVGEPEIYVSKGSAVHQLMGKQLATKNVWKSVASSSRMCGIQPYALQKNGVIKSLKDQPHRFTGISFALIHKQFVIDYPVNKFPYRYITAIIRPDFYKSRLGHSTAGRVYYPKFVPAHTFLKLDRGAVRVKRDIYSYQFPTYWLNVKKLLVLINKLRKKEKKSAITTITPGMLDKLVTSNDRRVRIADISVVPSAMRALVDKHVPDMPELKITPAPIWYASMDRMIHAARLQQVL